MYRVNPWGSPQTRALRMCVLTGVDRKLGSTLTLKQTAGELAFTVRGESELPC